MYRTLFGICAVSLLLSTVFAFVKQVGVITLQPMSINLEYKPSTIPFFLLCAINILIPFAFIACVTAFSTSQNKRKKGVLYLLGFYGSMLATLAFTEFLKFMILKQRPDFLNRKQLIVEARRSFPSGDSAAGFCFLLPTLFILAVEHYNILVKLIALMVLVAWGIVIAYFRIKNHKHDVTDVCMGMNAGIMPSILVLYVLNNKLKLLQENREDSEKHSESGEKKESDEK